MWTILAAVIVATAPAVPAAVDPEDGVGPCKRWLADDVGQEVPLQSVSAPPMELVDVLHYDLELVLVPDDQWLSGGNTITARSLVDGLVDVDVRLHDAFEITAVESGDASTTWERLSPTTIRVDLDRPYVTDEVFDIRIEYEGYPVPSGFGSIAFTSRGGQPLVFTLSEPWYAYTWWPALDDNRDKATGELTITVPDPLTVASNGVLLGVITDFEQGTHEYHWGTEYQTATYLFSFSAALYEQFSGEYEHDAGVMPVDFFIFPDSDTPSHRSDWLLTVDMLEVFSSLFGEYPFLDEKYGIYQFGFGGGMEHQTMTGQGGFGSSLTAHELGHQWWGDMITCATWQDIWLNEGFATYSEALWRQYRPGSAGEAALHAHMDNRRPSDVSGSVYIPEGEATSINRIFSSSLSYRKGAWVLHQLRHVVGDEAFFGTLAAYRQAFEYDAATTADFQAVAESVHGADLDWFFDTWVYGVGAPAYTRSWQFHESGWLELYVEQIQSAAYPIFTMPLDVRVTTIDGDFTHIVWNDAEAEHFLLPLASTPVDVQLDPYDWTLHTGNVVVGWTEGPPKVVSTVPAPGEQVVEVVSTLTVSFHEPVIASAADFVLVGDLIGVIEVDAVLGPGNATATLEPPGPLPPDQYTLTVRDSVIDQVGQLALDGERLDPLDPEGWPSGDGLPGGDAVIRFTVATSAPPADVNGDGVVDVDDMIVIITSWGPCPAPPAPCDADVNGDGVVDVDDLVAVLLAWDGG